MFKEFLIRKMVERQLKDVPAEQRDMIIKVVTENPELFKKIAEEVQAKVKSGKDQTSAMMEVMQAHQDELKRVLGK